ncbi:MAG TPA: hypothetical protein VMB02_12755 [Candidatus Aquilonibacter sp.]|nr:hypothetical protein [Candidatus Aquilonibacter sp.]
MEKFAAILAALVLSCAAATLAPTAAAQQSYVFASPNTRQTLTDADARASLTSFEQLNAIAIADRIACSFASGVRITGVLGIYDTSAENSFVVESHLNRAQAEYAGSLLARYEHQKYALLFFPAPGGHDRLWAIQTPKSFDEAAAAARGMRLTPITLRPESAGNEIWVVDIGNKFGDRPKQLAAQLSGGASVQNGSAEVIGEEDRANASLFDTKIAAFESGAKTKLSPRLWTAAWHDASTRTCSTEAPE